MTGAVNDGDLISSKLVDGIAVIEFQRGGIRDEREVLQALESLARYVQSKKGLKILLDLGNVEYMTSAGLGRLVSLLKKTRTAGSVLKLCRLREGIQEIFEVMHLNQIFEAYPDADEAVASFSKSREKEPTL